MMLIRFRLFQGTDVSDVHRAPAEIANAVLATSCIIIALVLLYSNTAYWVGVVLALISASLFMALGIRWFRAAQKKRSPPEG
jgi:membrane protein implicated in regulation of membrane protease activity